MHCVLRCVNIFLLLYNEHYCFVVVLHCISLYHTVLCLCFAAIVLNVHILLLLYKLVIFCCYIVLNVLVIVTNFKFLFVIALSITTLQLFHQNFYISLISYQISMFSCCFHIKIFIFCCYYIWPTCQYFVIMYHIYAIIFCCYSINSSHFVVIVSNAHILLLSHQILICGWHCFKR